MDPRLIRLAAQDNVLMVGTTIPSGDVVEIDGSPLPIPAALSLGHKVAARRIAAGETILKYNFPIGIATEDIPQGAHVHVHNVRSDYTPTHTIEEV